MNEAQETRLLANRILDRVNADPDDDLAMLSRQLLRAEERIERLKEALRCQVKYCSNGMVHTTAREFLHSGDTLPSS